MKTLERREKSSEEEDEEKSRWNIPAKKKSEREKYSYCLYYEAELFLKIRFTKYECNILFFSDACPCHPR